MVYCVPSNYVLCVDPEQSWVGWGEIGGYEVLWCLYMDKILHPSTEMDSM